MIIETVIRQKPPRGENERILRALEGGMVPEGSVKALEGPGRSLDGERKALNTVLRASKGKMDDADYGSFECFLD